MVCWDLTLLSWYYIWVVVKIMGPFLGTLNNKCRIIIGTQKGTMTTTHMKPLWGITLDPETEPLAQTLNPKPKP